MKQISVIVPAYNAEKLIRKAVESALQFEEVGEVILVEDGSPDNTLDVCVQLEKEYSKVKLYRHPDGVNKGAGATRNLGIRKASNDYIAFLDADDYYLPNRFDAERKLLPDDDSIDGIYGAIGTVYYSKAAKENFGYKFSQELLTVSKNINPEDLRYALLGMGRDDESSSFFHLDALTVKKSLIEKAGYFNEKLRLHQDSDIIIKMSFLGNLVPGIIGEPVGMRGIHEQNRITTSAFGYNSRYIQFVELEKWLIENNFADEKIIRYVRKYISGYDILKNKNTFSKASKLFRLFKRQPYLIYLEKEFNYLFKGVFGNNIIVKTIVKLKNMVFNLLFAKRIEKWQLFLYH
jgi:glycosyltransferase involved in cell wall biosynthesis